MKLRNRAKQDSSLLSNVVVSTEDSWFSFSNLSGFINNESAHTYPLRTLAPHDSNDFTKFFYITDGGRLLHRLK